jgi:hypothetical protein
MLPGKTNSSSDRQNTKSEQIDSSANPKASEDVVAARQQAEEDIQQDADLSIHSPNDDLDEGETARLGEDKTDLV